MKNLINLIFVLFLNSCVSQKNIKITILRDKILNNQISSVTIKNNSAKNYCFLIDTINYERNLQKYIPTYHNPEIKLFEVKEGELYTSVKGAFDGTRGDYSNEKKKYINPHIIFIKSGKVLNLKIPFNVISNYKCDGFNPNFYEIDKNKKYYCRVVYKLKNKYIKSILPKKRIDSITKKGYVFFTGELQSNKVPFIIDQSANYEPAGFYDK